MTEDEINQNLDELQKAGLIEFYIGEDGARYYYLTESGKCVIDEEVINIH